MSNNSSAESNGATKGRELSLREAIAIGEWLKEKAKDMQASNRPWRVQKLREDAGIQCTVEQLARVERELGYTEWGNTYVRRRNAAADRTALVAKALEELYALVHVKPPAYLRAIARRATAQQVSLAPEGGGASQEARP